MGIKKSVDSSPPANTNILCVVGVYLKHFNTLLKSYPMDISVSAKKSLFYCHGQGVTPKIYSLVSHMQRFFRQILNRDIYNGIDFFCLPLKSVARGSLL